MPNAGNTPPGREPERLGGGDERLDGGRVDRLGARQGQRQRRQVEVLRPASAPGSPAPTRSWARPSPCRRSRRSTASSCRVGQEVLRRGLHELGARRHRDRRGNPTRPMSWYSGSHDSIDVGRRRARRPRTSASMLRRQHPVGDHHALRLAGRAARVLQDDEPLGVGRRELERVAAGTPAAPGSTDAHRLDRRIAGGRPRRTRPAGRRSARAWRRRGGCAPGSTRRTPRATPSASAAAAPSRRCRPSSSRGRS